MGLLSLFAVTVFAAESIISPLPEDEVRLVVETKKPDISFGSIAHTAVASVLGATTNTVPAPSPVVRRAKKSNFTIAVLGDSMVDTLGPNVPNLKSELSTEYPGVTFSILNYGVGGTNIEYGLERLTHEYTYLGKQIPPLLSEQPDIVVIESFGYNPIPNEPSLDRHWLDLSHVVDVIKSGLPGAQIVIAATIAPHSGTFGDGAAGISFSAQDKSERTTLIKSYLENTVRFAKSQRLPLADAYHASLDSSGNGRLTYINQGDHIHYSDAGRALFAQKVVEAIVGNKLLE